MPILPTRPELLTPADADLMHIVDVSDTTDDVTGSSKKMKMATLRGYAKPDQATESVTGVAELATQAETDTGTDDLRIVTPLKLQSKVATETAKGIIEIATLVETDAGTDDTLAITPLKLATGKWGAMVKLSSLTVANDATIEITDIDGTYGHYILSITDLIVQNDDVDLRLRVSEDNGATFKSGAADYNWVVTGRSADNKDPTNNSAADDHISIAGEIGGGKGIGNAIGETYEGEISLHFPGGSNNYKMISTKANYINTGGFVMMVNNSGEYQLTVNPIDAVQIFLSSGLMVSGTIELYGIK